MSEFEVTIVTVRTGSHTVRIMAEDPASARDLVQAECDAGEHHCPPEWCTDDLESNVLHVRRVDRDRVVLIGDHKEHRPRLA